MKQSKKLAKTALKGERHRTPLAALRVLFVQLEKLARQRVLIARQVSFEKEEVEMARLVPRVQQECTRIR